MGSNLCVHLPIGGLDVIVGPPICIRDAKTVGTVMVHPISLEVPEQSINSHSTIGRQFFCFASFEISDNLFDIKVKIVKLNGYIRKTKIKVPQIQLPPALGPGKQVPLEA